MLIDTSQVSKLRLSTLTRRYIDIPCASVVLFKSAFESYVGWLSVGQEDFDILDKLDSITVLQNSTEATYSPV